MKNLLIVFCVLMTSLSWVAQAGNRCSKMCQNMDGPSYSEEERVIFERLERVYEEQGNVLTAEEFPVGLLDLNIEEEELLGDKKDPIRIVDLTRTSVNRFHSFLAGLKQEQETFKDLKRTLIVVQPLNGPGRFAIVLLRIGGGRKRVSASCIVPVWGGRAAIEDELVRLQGIIQGFYPGTTLDEVIVTEPEPGLPLHVKAIREAIARLRVLRAAQQGEAGPAEVPEHVEEAGAAAAPRVPGSIRFHCAV